MPTLQQITDKIVRGQLLQANLTLTSIKNEGVGDDFNNWNRIVCIDQLVEGLETQVSIMDYTSSITVNIYNRLSGQIGLQFIDGATFDPNAQQSPGVIYINNQAQIFNVQKYPFNAQVVTFTSWKINYYPLFGNDPEISIFILNAGGTYSEDKGTTPTYTYTVPGNPLSDIVSIEWDFGIVQQGYIQVSGIQPQI